MDDLERKLRMEIATRQLQIDQLKRVIREKDDIIEKNRIDQGGWKNADNHRQRSNPPGEKAEGTSKSSISDK